MRLRMLILAAGLLWPVSSFSQGSGEEYFLRREMCFWKIVLVRQTPPLT
jgi:hypothetical protein